MSEPLKPQRPAEAVRLEALSSADSAGLCGSHGELDWLSPLGADSPVWWTDPDRHPEGNVIKRVIAGCAPRSGGEASITWHYKSVYPGAVTACRWLRKASWRRWRFKKLCDG